MRIKLVVPLLVELDVPGISARSKPYKARAAIQSAFEAAIDALDFKTREVYEWDLHEAATVVAAGKLSGARFDLPSPERDLDALRRTIGAKALRVLRSGGLLHIWRRSSPHNWWIAAKTRPHNYHWHSAEGEPRPALSMFDLVSDSAECIVQYWGSDAGQPEHSTYQLKEDYR